MTPVVLTGGAGTVMSRPVTELAGEFFPRCHGVATSGRTRRCWTARRRTALGCEPRYSWRSEVAAGDQDP
jgi:hypothetical protein